MRLIHTMTMNKLLVQVDMTKRMITALTTVLIYILKVTIRAMTALTVHLVGLKYLVI